MLPRTAILLLVCLLTLVPVYLFLFRKETVDNSELGIFVQKYKWGKAFEITVDVDRDGVVEGRYLVDGFSPHDRIFEGWEASICNGQFDIHMLFDSSSVLESLEYDEDKDGHFEAVYYKEEARNFLADLQRPCARRAPRPTTKKRSGSQ